MKSKDASTLAGVVLALGTGILTYEEVLPGWGFVVCVMLAAFLIFPDRVGKFLKHIKDALSIRGS